MFEFTAKALVKSLQIRSCVNLSVKPNHHSALPVQHEAYKPHVIPTLSTVLAVSARSLKHVRARNWEQRCPAALRSRFSRRAVSRSFVAHFPTRFAQICTRLSSDQLVHSIVNNKTAVCKTEVRKSADFEMRQKISTWQPCTICNACLHQIYKNSVAYEIIMIKKIC